MGPFASVVVAVVARRVGAGASIKMPAGTAGGDFHVAVVARRVGAGASI